MIVRYQGLLKNVKSLSDNLQAEANYWIGWGLVKTNAAKDAITYLEKARTLRPDAYGKHAGLLLALGYFASQDPAEARCGNQSRHRREIRFRHSGPGDPMVRHAVLQRR